MSLKKYLLVMLASNAVLWVAWALILTALNPASGGWLALTLFYASLGLALAGTFSLLGFFIRSLVFRSTPHFRHLGASHRQGFLLAALAVGSLILQSQRAFTWWSGALLFLIVCGVEYMILARQQSV